MKIQDYFLNFNDETTFSAAFDTLYPHITVEDIITPEKPEYSEEYTEEGPVPEPEPIRVTRQERSPEDPNLLVDPIGVISEPTGETITDPETGDEYPVMRPVPGYHVNARCVDRMLPDGWAQYVIPRPQTPVREFAPWVEPPPQMTLEDVKETKFAEFDALFQRLDALKIRPAAGISEALAAAEPIPSGDAYRLSELEAITAENRALREMVQAAQTVDAVRAVSVWWPGEGEAVG